MVVPSSTSAVFVFTDLWLNYMSSLPILIKGYFDAALLILIPEETFLERILFWSSIKPPLELVNYLARYTSHWHMTRHSVWVSPTGIHNPWTSCNSIQFPLNIVLTTLLKSIHSPYCWPAMPGHLSTWTRSLTHSSPYAYRPGFVLVVVSRKFLSKVTHSPLKGHFCTHSRALGWHGGDDICKDILISCCLLSHSISSVMLFSLCGLLWFDGCC